MKKEIKEKIVEALEDVKEFDVSYAEEVVYSKTFKAKSKEELEEKFENGELEFDNRDITDSKFCDDSLDIFEVEK